MKKTTRTLSLLLACLMVLGVCPLAVFATDTAAEEPAVQAEAKPYYTYYVQDGLTFLWSGEDYEIGDKEETVKALVNILNPDQKLDKMMYGRQFYNLAKNDGNGNVTFKTMAYKKANGGVVMVGDGNFIYTDIVPTTMVGDVEVLTDMTFEVSQSYFDKIATSTATTYSSTRGHDGGIAWYGPLGSIGNNKMPYKAMPVGSTLYHYAEYADTNGVATPFYYLSGKLVATNTEFYTYADGSMTKITDETVIKAIQDQITAQTLTIDGKTANLYRWKGVGNDYSSFLAMDAYGTAGVYQHNSTMNYDKVGQNQFLNNTINQAFTSTIIFDYAAVEASTKFDFTVGRDGVKYAAAATNQAYDATVDKSVGTYFSGASGTYNGVTLTKNETFLGFIGERDSNHTSGTGLTNMLAYSINDEGRNFAFTFGVNVATVLHSIRMYDRVLTDAELAQNHFVDVAMKLGADLSVFDKFASLPTASMIKKAYDQAYALTAGKDEGDFTKASFEAAIQEIYDNASPYYHELYVQDGLVFLWTGEGNQLTNAEQKVTAFENFVGEKDIDKISYGRHYSHYYQGKSFTFYKTDKGVHNNGGNNFGLILTNLVPTREYNGENILSDMTLEVSQAYPSTYQTKLGGTVNISTRNFDPGYVLLGALGAQSYTRVAYKQEYAKNASGTLRNFVPYYYVPNAYADDLTYDAEILYVDVSASASTNKEFPIYRKNESGVMIATTTDKHGNPIDDVYLNPKGNAAGTGAATGVYVDTATGKLYYTYAPYYATRNSKVALNANGHIQGGVNLPGIDALGTTLISNWSGNLTAYDYPLNGRPNFMNAKQDQAFTTTMIFNYDENATSTSIPFTFTAGRDGAFLNTTNHTYDTTKDYTPAEKKWDNDSKSDDNTTYNADKTVASTETVQKYAFSYGIGTAMTYYAIRLYDRALTAAEQAQNNFIDIAYQLDLNLAAYASADAEVKAAVHALTAGKSASDVDVDELTAQINLLVKGGSEYAEILDANVITFDGYAIRLNGYAGLRSVFKLNYDFINEAEANTSAKITEIGAIVGIKGEYNDTVEDLTVAGGRQMTKNAIYENGEWAEDNLIYRTSEDGELDTYFALTTTFKNAEEQTKIKYETELLFRGYVTIDVDGEKYTMYTDMSAPSFDKVSMRGVSEVFASRGWEYKDVKTIKDVLATCGLDMPYADKIWAADSFLKADGSLDTESTGELNVLFIGGSLTEQGRTGWAQNVKDYIKTLFPNKTVNYLNVGVGGTNSEGAANRFGEHVAPFKPDIIFVDYTVNDDMNSFSEEKAQFNMESILYQCAQLDKIPSVVYLHTPPATLPGSAVYNKWAKQRDYKEEWAKHYSIETINIYDYSYGKWEKEVAAGETTADYITWLDDYYGDLQEENTTNNNNYGRYNVHGGYQLYEEAVIEALDERAAELFRPYRFMPYMHPNKTSDIERITTFMHHDDEALTYSDGWVSYEKYDADVHGGNSNPLRIPSNKWTVPYMANGVHQATAGEYVTFTTRANTLCIYYMPAYAKLAEGSTDTYTGHGADFVIYVNGVKVSTNSACSSAMQPFFTNTVNLGNPNNEEITVRIEIVGRKGIENPIARFGSIYLGYDADFYKANMTEEQN